MATLVIGDLHGCGMEFVELLDIARRDRVDARIILVGDLFTKGPRPDLVVEVISELRAAGRRVESVCGNHDLRLMDALRRCDAGATMDELAPAEEDAIRVLERSGKLTAARRILTETISRTHIQGPGWAVVHGGIDPQLGLAGTSDFEKIHKKAPPGRPHWWESYNGEDGLIIVGHKPLFEPMVLRRDGDPIVVNVDTGCAYGGSLTAYCIEEDRLIMVPSQQPSRDGFGATPVATAPRWASGGPVRTFARRP
ncbi:MAG: metallophosphoesterase [Planctomycetes bacterium]|nr:metallophosphoesterase [Planctomycetota bacterium]